MQYMCRRGILKFYFLPLFYTECYNYKFLRSQIKGKQKKLWKHIFYSSEEQAIQIVLVILNAREQTERQDYSEAVVEVLEQQWSITTLAL